jgi:hypothetical protein
MNNEMEFLVYRVDGKETAVNAIIEDETIWLTQKVMSMLFDVESNTITYHLKEIYATNELDEKATTRKIRVVRNEGDRKVSRELL